MKNIIALFLSTFLCIFTLPAQDFQVVLLPDNQAFIHEQPSFPLQKGRQQILLPDIPHALDFSSFYISPMTQGIMLNTMGIKSASMSLGNLLHHNLNKRITILMPNGDRISGSLIEWFDDGKRLYLKSNQNQPVLLELQEPYGLFFEQDTVFFQSKDFYKRYFMEVESDKKRQAQFELGYLVDKMYWKVEYIALLNEKENRCRLMGWLNLENDCGKDFSQAKVGLLIGGEPRIYSDYSLWQMLLYSRFARHLRPQPLSSYRSFEEKNLTDFKLFSLKRLIHLPQSVSRKFPLFSPLEVKVAKEYWLTVRSEETWVEARLNIENRKENGLGFTLPKGKFQIFKNRGDQKTFITSVEIEHIPALDRVQILLGRLFDVKAWHRIKEVTPVDKDSLADSVQVTYELNIQSFKTEPITLKLIVLHFEEHPLQILKIPVNDYTLEDDELRFTIPFPARKKKKIRYTVLERKYL